MRVKQIRLGISPITDNVYAGTIKENRYEWHEGKQDVTEDFKRCIVHFCTESVEFEIDGMKFKATCERVD